MVSIRRDDAFERIVDEAVSVEERAEMSASAQRFALIFWIRKSVLAEHRRLYLYADEHPEAAQDLVDPSIRLSERDGSEHSWTLPAGWVRIVNDLHADLSRPLGEYEVTYAGQKDGGLRFRTSPVARGEAAERIDAARAASMTVCEVCGGNSQDRDATAVGDEVPAASALASGQDRRRDRASPGLDHEGVTNP